MDSRQFWAGASMVDITPPLGTKINGDFLLQTAKTINDNLYCKSLALKSGQETIVLTVVDTCYMPVDFLAPIRKEISLKTGLSEKNFLFCATHTHSGGALTEIFLGATDIPYRTLLPGLIINSIVTALEKLTPAKVAFGSIEVPDHILCRRYFMDTEYNPINPVSGQTEVVKTNPFGAEGHIVGPVAQMDSQLSYLGVKSLDDQWISLFGNYSLHYVGDFDPNTISADYFGAFAAEMKNILNADDNFVGILTNGTSGEANIWDFLGMKQYPSGKFEKSRSIANDLANKIFESLEGLVWENMGVISSEYEDLHLEVRKPSKIELEEAVALIEDERFENISSVDIEVLKKIYAREQILLNELEDKQVLAVQAIRIGNSIIGGLAGEFFAETGLILKRDSPFANYFSIGLANGVVGYVPPIKEFERGGYETWRCRSSKLKEDSEAIVRAGLLKLIRKVAF